MDEIDRRGALCTLLGGVILAGAGASLWSQDAAALAEVSPTDHPASGGREPAAETYAQNTRPSPGPANRPSGRPPRRPSHRPPPRRRRRRRWECWWHRGRRQCGWRWR
jgi:hypothetical protein